MMENGSMKTILENWKHDLILIPIGYFVFDMIDVFVGPLQWLDETKKTVAHVP